MHHVMNEVDLLNLFYMKSHIYHIMDKEILKEVLYLHETFIAILAFQQESCTYHITK